MACGPLQRRELPCRAPTCARLARLRCCRGHLPPHLPLGAPCRCRRYLPQPTASLPPAPPACLPAATQELCDVTLRYLPPEQMGLKQADLPRSAWPPPRAQLPPFHDGFTDYLRAVAPGVYVG